MRLCTRCHYDLRDLPAGPCPECGRDFDPADERTYITGPDARAARWLNRACLTVTMLPLFCWLMMQVTWLLAMLSLGHRPRPSIDDPKDIAAITPFYWATLILLILMPLAIGGLLVLPLSALSQHRWRRMALPMCVGGLSIVLGVTLLRWDPFDVSVWFMD